MVPYGDAVDGVGRVGQDGGVKVVWGEVQRTHEGGEFGALVGLAGAGEGFREVAREKLSVESGE